MKKTTKAMVIGSVLFVCSVTGLFAKEAPKAPAPQNKNGNVERMHNHRGKQFGPAPFMDGPKIMGVVSSVDEKNSSLKIKNADGKDVVIHINPLTVVFQAAKDEKFPVKNATIAEIQKGTWVCVQKYNTETTAVEAKNIFAIPEGVEMPKMPRGPQFKHDPKHEQPAKPEANS